MLSSGLATVAAERLDSLALRRPDWMARLRVLEVDDPATPRWKRRRITAVGLHPPPGLSFVPVDFESGQPWIEAIVRAKFDLASSACTVPGLAS